MAEALAGHLTAAVAALRAEPQLLHAPELAFFKEYLLSLGATIPHAQSTATDDTDEDMPDLEEMAGTATGTKSEAPASENAASGESASEEEPEEEVEPDNELMPKDEPPYPPMEAEGDADEDRATELKIAASDAMENGRFDVAVDKYSEAIKLGAVGALVHAKRAKALLKLRRPYAAKLDCDKALEINNDSAAAYRVRGMAHRYLGEYVHAAEDFRQAQRIDYDNSIVEMHSFVEQRTAKVVAKQRAKEQKEQARRQAEREEAIQRQRAQQQQQRQQQQQQDDENGAGFDFASMLTPELMELMQKPNVMAAFTAIQQDPSSLSAYMNDPDVMRAVELMSKASPAFGGGFGMGGSAPSAGRTAAPEPTFEEID